uniref:Uncharacterized protein n=1 Tax=Heterorhabditis bacteriophora TaxID=37862 RepID=A0A1I7WFR5_HETBA
MKMGVKYQELTGWKEMMIVLINFFIRYYQCKLITFIIYRYTVKISLPQQDLIYYFNFIINENNIKV